jgi:SAM-dependent methyltransferase
VNWEGRLAHELPFFQRLFEERQVVRVLDSACGTGHHAIALARQGYQVMGTDLSAVMVERARQNAATAGASIAFQVVGLGELDAMGETFDAVLCLGNSLPHLLTPQALAEALADFAAVLQPGGLLVIQNRNFDMVWAAQERFMPPQTHRDGDQEWLFLRFYDFHEGTITFNMIRLRRTEQGWEQGVESTELRPVLHQDLANGLKVAGFEQVLLYGSYDGSAFDPAQSGDLIAVATRSA